MTYRKNILNFLELIAIISIFLLTTYFTAINQKTVSHNDGQGWDGTEYYKMAEDFTKGVKAETRAPFVYRIGTPFLVSHYFANDILKGFFKLNQLAAFLSIILMFIFLKFFINSRLIRILLMFLFITQWHNWARLVYFYPVHVDPWAQVAVLAGLILIYKSSTLPETIVIPALSILTFTGLFFRETAVIIAVVYVLSYLSVKQIFDYKNYIQTIKSLKFRWFIPFISGIAATIIIRFFSHSTTNYMFPAAASYWIYYKPVLQFLHSLLASYGPVLVLIILFYKETYNFLSRKPFLLYFSGIIFILSWIGGGDTERFLYWAAPVVFASIGYLLENNKTLQSVLKSTPLIILVLIITQAIAQRLFWVIPDFPPTAEGLIPTFLTPLSGVGNFHNVFVPYMEYKTAIISFGEYVLLFAGLFFWMKKRMVDLGIKELKD